MRYFFSLLIPALVIASPVFGQMNKIAFEQYTLDNGLHVILHQDKTTPIVAVSVMYHVGSKNENPERTGFAHFFEHLMFEGSDNIGRGEFDKYVQNAGGTLNANTTFDRTYYFEVLPSNQLALGLWLESERMLHARVDEKGIETQREVVKEERRQRIDNQPYGSILEETFKRAYTIHPYKWPVIGSMAHLEAAEEQDYKQFYADFYVPNNAVLSIAGDIDIAEAKAFIQEYFGGIPKSAKAVYRPRVVEPPLAGEIRDTIYDNIQLPAVIQAYRIPAQGTKDYYAVDMVSKILSSGESSRLYKSLVDEQQKALFVGNFPLALEDPGVSLSFGITNMGVDVYELEKSIDAEVSKVQNELISEKEFEKLRNQIEAEYVTSNSRVAGIAESLATYDMFFGDANLINNEIDRYLAVTREDIQAAAKKYLVKNNRVTLHYLPKSLENKS
ncbi:MAG: insulinase family protein [Saprospiraceae bacterium]|nr:insulinase family protein [Saprospiraceae bacterium]